MNNVNLIGRVCAQPGIKYVGHTNRPVCEFTLAYDDPFNKDGTGKNKAYFFYVIIWGHKAEVAHQHMLKGQRVGITGRLVQEEFTPKGQDKPVQKTRIVAESFDLLEKPKGYQSSTAESERSPTQSPSNEPEPDDVPF
jgi:single-strand DNA-binding protein